MNLIDRFTLTDRGIQTWLDDLKKCVEFLRSNGVVVPSLSTLTVLAAKQLPDGRLMIHVRTEDTKHTIMITIPPGQWNEEKPHHFCE